MGRIFPKRGYFANFQSSISPLRLMIELRSSLLTYRNSYIAYPKKIIFNDLELLYQGQMAHVSSISLFSPKRATQLSPNTSKTSEKTYCLVVNIIHFSDF